MKVDSGKYFTVPLLYGALGGKREKKQQTALTMFASYLTAMRPLY